MIENIYPNEYKEKIGIYTPAKKIDLGNCYLIFVSGIQVSVNKENEVISSDIEIQTIDVFQNIEMILKSAGASMDNIVKAQIFLTDINDFTKVSKIRDEWFQNCKPTSTLVEVNAMTRKGAKIEIEVTAIVPK